MNLLIEEKKEKRILKFKENFTVYEAADIKKEIVQLLSKKKALELDLGEVEECDAAGIQILLSIINAAKSRKSKLSITCLSDSVEGTATGLGIDCREVLGLREEFNVEDDNDG